MKYFFICFLLSTTISAFGWHVGRVGDAPIRWHSSNDRTAFKVQTSSFPVGSSFRRALNDAVANWNQSPGRIRIGFNPDTDWVSVSNGVNEIWFTDNNLVLDGAPAICIRHFNVLAFGVWNLTEADVVFNVAETYSGNVGRRGYGFYGGSLRPLRSTALHELGHALGLNHEDLIYNIMGEDFTHLYVNGTMLSTGRGEDASEGLRQIYGAHPDAVPDLGATHWKYSGKDGEYSVHQFTGLFTPEGAMLPATMDGAADRDPGMNVFDVRRGQRFQAEFTFENNGPRTESVSISYYLSTNSLITTGDRGLGIIVGRDLIRDQPDTVRFTLRVPTDIAPGRYYVGTIVDSGDRVRESNESNNAAYHVVNVL